MEDSQQINLIVDPETIQIEQVCVYLRLVNSKSFKIYLPSHLPYQKLSQVVQEKTGIKSQQQILYCKGKEISKHKEVKLFERAIIHVKCAEEKIESITVNIIKYMPQKKNIFRVNLERHTMSIKLTETIEDFLKAFLKETSDQIQLERTKVIECGRFLRLDKTFEEQKIQSEAEVHLILKKLVNPEEDQKQEDNILIEQVLKSSTHLSKKQKVETPLQNTLQNTQQNLQKNNVIQNLDLAVTSNSFMDNDFHDQNCQIIGGKSEPNIPNYFSPTKSSGLWKSQKTIKIDPNPMMRFSLKEFKKYEGPKSIRACNCKRKNEFYELVEGGNKSSGNQSPQQNSPKGSRQGSKKLKYKMTFA